MKKFINLKCTNCKRSIDKLVDITHFAPDQCTITLGCEGRLRPVDYKSNASIVVAPEVGLTDWRPRTSKISSVVADAVPSLVNLETGALKQIVIGVARTTAPLDTEVLTIPFTLKSDVPKDYRQYVYRKDGSFQTISGVESGLAKKTLRYSTDDLVEVFLNGVKLEIGTAADQYQLFGPSTSPAGPNSIFFNTAIDSASTTQVDVIVSKAETATIIHLAFNRNVLDESRVGTGAFENISFMDRLIDSTWVRYYLFTYDLNDVDIPLNSIMIPDVQDSFFMLARSPYSQLDRYMDILAAFDGLSLERDYLKFFAENSSTTLRIASTAVTTIFPPMRAGKFSTEVTIKTALAGVSEQVLVDGKVITGPDA